MLFENPFSAGSVPSFPAKTLCLTYDDGPFEVGGPLTAPGPHSLEQAEYLASQGVQATFFMVGRNLQQFPGMAAEMSALGHQVGVHTYDHVPLDDCVKANGDVVRQIALTGALMPNSIDAPFYLRAPYGQWSPAVAQAMNADFMTALNCFGPIHWDNSISIDWEAWQAGVDPHIVAQQYLDEINGMGKGVILMHDNCADRAHLRKKNMGLTFARLLVPQLKSAGYNMVRVDAIADIAAQAANSPGLALRGANQLYVSPQGGGGGQVLVSAAAPSPTERLTAISLGGNRYAFRVSGGQYLSEKFDGSVNPVTATATEVEDWETFEAAPWKTGTVVFRAFSGDYLTFAADGILNANGWPTDPNCAFSPFWYPAGT
jgi:peptidoglycan/xylan/chitin deacetylase (PgdA/CDA1 family)